MKRIFCIVLFVLICTTAWSQKWSKVKRNADPMLDLPFRYEYISVGSGNGDAPTVHIFSNDSKVYLSSGRYSSFDTNYDVHKDQSTIDVVIGFFDNNGNLIDKLSTSFRCIEYDWVVSTAGLGNTIIKWIKAEGYVTIYAKSLSGYRLTYNLKHKPDMVNNKVKL